MTLLDRSFRRSATASAALVLAVGTGLVPLGAQNAPSSKAFDRLFAPEARVGALKVSVFEGVDAVDNQGLVSPGEAAATGTFTGINSTVFLSSKGKTVSTSVDGGAAIRRYASVGQFALLNGRGAASVQIAGRRSGLRMRQSLSHAPYYDFLGLADGSGNGGSLSARPDGAAYDRSVTTAASSAEFARQLSRTAIFAANYSFSYSHFGEPAAGAPPLKDTNTHEMSARVAKQFGRYTSLFAGYGTRMTTEPASWATSMRTQDISFGVDRAQQFSLLRRTTLQVQTGSSIAQVPEGHRFFLTGKAVLSHDLSRTWSVSALASRGVVYIEGLTVPVLSDVLQFSVGGPVSRRFDLSSYGGFSRGNVGLTAANTNFRAYSATGRARALLTRDLGLYGEYTVYRHEFEYGSTLPGVFDRMLNRQGWRVGMTMNVPLQETRSGQRGVR